MIIYKYPLITGRYCSYTIRLIHFDMSTCIIYNLNCYIGTYTIAINPYSTYVVMTFICCIITFTTTNITIKLKIHYWFMF